MLHKCHVIIGTYRATANAVTAASHNLHSNHRKIKCLQIS